MIIYENLLIFVSYVILCILIVTSLEIWKSLKGTIASLVLIVIFLLGLLAGVPVFQTDITGIPDRVEKAGDRYSVVMNGQRYDDVEAVFDRADEYSVRISKQETLFGGTYETVTLTIPTEVKVLK